MLDKNIIGSLSFLNSKFKRLAESAYLGQLSMTLQIVCQKDKIKSPGGLSTRRYPGNDCSI